MQEADKIYEEIKKRGISYNVELNASNGLAFIGKINDLIGISSIAFKNNIAWIPNTEIPDNQIANSSNGGNIPDFRMVFWISFSISITYAFLAK